MDSLNFLSPILEIFTLSMIIADPSSHSVSLNRAYRIEDLPDPVRPTIPIFEPDSTLKVIPLSTGEKVSLYRMTTFSKEIAPLIGQFLSINWS